MADHRSRDGTFNGGKAFEMLSLPSLRRMTPPLGLGDQAASHLKL